MDDGEQRRRRVRSRPGGPPPTETEIVDVVEVEIVDVVEIVEVVTMAVTDEVAVEPEPAAEPEPDLAPVSTRHPAPPRGTREPWRPDSPRVPTAEDKESERGLRGLIGGGSSQVSVAAAMRARDSSRPTDADLARAAATLAIVHRGWVPRDSA
jgi:hypothetical protein